MADVALTGGQVAWLIEVSGQLMHAQSALQQLVRLQLASAQLGAVQLVQEEQLVPVQTLLCAKPLRLVLVQLSRAWPCQEIPHQTPTLLRLVYAYMTQQ